MNAPLRKHPGECQAGFTLVELLMVLALIGITLAVIFEVFFGSYRSWAHNEAINPKISATNSVLTLLSREIRSAEQPTAAEAAVQALDSGKQLVIYKYNLSAGTDPWEKICYRYSGSTLQRTVLRAATGEEIAQLNFPDDSADWEDILSGTSNQADSFTIDAATGKVDIALAVADVTKPSGQERFREYQVASTYFPRNRTPGSMYSEPVEEEEELPDVLPYKIAILGKNNTWYKPNTITVQRNMSVIVKARFWPANVTNQEVNWSVGGEHPDYITIAPDPSNPLQVTVTAGNQATTWPWCPTLTARATANDKDGNPVFDDVKIDVN